ncbi:glycine cleavage system protein GcvH [Streptomyces caeni]|uniref:Glycine cleavage system H protein n=1 Tax=Streptomyces caeni TaxID=2307231 RepID=A0ABW4IQC0_9ACTN
MALVKKCNLPDDLYYLVERHVWARQEDGLVVVGMTDVAQNLAKTIISVTLKGAGKTVRKGRNVATVESGKWVGPVPAPVSGEIVEVNQALVSSPSLINSDPYQAGWVAKIRAADWEADSADLVTGAAGLEAYQSFLDAEGIVCDGG